MPSSIKFPRTSAGLACVRSWTHVADWARREAGILLPESAHVNTDHALQASSTFLQEVRPDSEHARSADPDTRVIHALEQAGQPLSRQALRDACRIRTHTLGEVLRALTASGAICAAPDGYALTHAPSR